MTQRRKKLKQESTETYLRLMNVLKSMIEEAKANGISFNERMDTLTCLDCGCYEKFDDNDKIVVCGVNGFVVENEKFIVIDQSEKTYRRNSIIHYKVTYSFICTACGLYQTQILKEKFSDA